MDFLKMNHHVLHSNDTLPKLLLRNSVLYPTKIAIREKFVQVEKTYTWHEYFQNVKDLALGLQQVSLSPGDRVVLIGDNCPEILFMDLAIQSLSAIPANIFPDAAPSNIKEIIQTLEATTVVVEGFANISKILKIYSTCPSIKTIISIQRTMSSESDPLLTCLDYKDLKKRGQLVQQQLNLSYFEKLVQETLPNVVCSITFTSGTTGSPKGVMHTHRNVLSFCNALRPFSLDQGKDSVFVGFPFSAISGRKQLQGDSLKFLTEVNIGSALANYCNEIRLFSKTAVLCIPYHWDKISHLIYQCVSQKSSIYQLIHKIFLQNHLFELYRFDPKQVSKTWRLFFNLIDFFIYRSVRKNIGLNRAKVCISGGTFLKLNTKRNLLLHGIRVYEAYGMSEFGGGIALQSKFSLQTGNVGQLLSGVEIRFSSDGELLVKGPGLMSGYFGDEELFKHVVKDGWYHSGDLGYLDTHEELWITGRKKDIIITAGGQKIQPTEIENKLKRCPFIEEALVIGEQRKFLAALLFIRSTHLPRVKELHQQISREIEAINIDLPRTKNIRKYELIFLDDKQRSDDISTPSKIKRSVLENKYHSYVEKMYT